MRKSSLIVLAVLIAGLSAPNVRADTFTDGTIAFAVASGGPAPSASFVIDNATGQFTSFSINWNGEVYDFAVVFSPPPPVFTAGPFPFSFSGSWCAKGPDGGACFGDTLPVDRFGLAGPGFLGIDSHVSGTALSADAIASGSYTVTETVVSPEPSSVALMVAGTGLLLLTGKRLVQSRQQVL